MILSLKVSPPKLSMHFCYPHMFHVPHLSWVYHVFNIVLGEYTINLLYVVLSILLYLLPLWPNLPPHHTWFSDTSLRSSHNVRDQVPHPYTTTCSTGSMRLNLHIYTDSKQADQRCWLNASRHYLNFFTYVDLIHHWHSQTFEFCHNFKGFISYNSCNTKNWMW